LIEVFLPAALAFLFLSFFGLSFVIGLLAPRRQTAARKPQLRSHTAFVGGAAPSIEKATRNLLNRGGPSRTRAGLQTDIPRKTKPHEPSAAENRVMLRCSKPPALYLSN
jgi:hypothetical protein